MGWLFGIISIAIVMWLIYQAYRHQKADWGHPILNILDGLNVMYCRYIHRLQASDMLPLPSQGAALVVANHSAGLDSLVLIALSRRPLRFLIDRNQYDRFLVRWLFDAIGCIPVDYGHRPEKALRAALRGLQQGEVIALYPQGDFWLPGRPKKFKRGALWLAQHTNCFIYPVYLTGMPWQGTVYGSLLVPGHVQARYFPPINASDDSEVKRLRHILDGELDKL